MVFVWGGDGNDPTPAPEATPPRPAQLPPVIRSDLWGPSPAAPASSAPRSCDITRNICEWVTLSHMSIIEDASPGRLVITN